MMQNIVDQTRALLGEYIGGATATNYNLPSYTPMSFRFDRESALSKRGIPKKNYEDLDKLVPISWI